MSYSFVVRAATKAEVIEKIREQFDSVEIAQPCHVRSRPIVQAAAFAHVALLPEDDSRDVRVACHGHLVGPWEPGNKLTTVRAVNAGVYAELIERE